MDWPADAVERRPVADLVAHARNARTHSDAQVAQIAASIEQWGWTMPVLVDEHGVIIAGHGRILAAVRLGLADVPVMTARGWTEEQTRAYRLADNKLALNASWDDGILALELSELHELRFDVGLIPARIEDYGTHAERRQSLLQFAPISALDRQTLPTVGQLCKGRAGGTW